jgi:hypothetical protein
MSAEALTKADVREDASATLGRRLRRTPMFCIGYRAEIELLTSTIKGRMNLD